MKNFTYLFIASLLSSSLFGQVTDLGGPKSSNSDIQFHSLQTSIVMPDFDLQTVLETNAINSANKVGPYMFGYEHIVSHNLSNSGEWEILQNGDRVWRLKVQSPGALSINLIFSDFWMPEGAHLHIYNFKKEMIEGAYTSFNNNDGNTLGTDLLKGDAVTIEYFEPAAQSGNGRLQLGMVVHGYKDINNWYGLKINESDACNMDAICPDGYIVGDQIRSVARITAGGGLCSGTLLNNVAEDGTPYFLTANHCNPSNMGSGIFKFNYNSSICASQSSSSSTLNNINNNINGSSFKAKKADSDFGLIELNSIPPASYNAYYSGWDNSGDIPTKAVGIHHPSGDVKKISFDDDALQSAAGLSSVANSEWRIEAWERNTTTEGGSSGSGLFDQNNRIVGQLHGGQASCANSINDYYGKFSMSWTGNGSNNASQRLQNWLDPQNTGVTSIDGWNPNPAWVSVEETTLENTFSVFPNPTNDILNISSADLSNTTFEISLTDMKGALVMKTVSNNSNTTISLASLEQGVYFLSIKSNDVITVKKIVKK